MTNVVARAPGRVNLLGEHTDYNDGFVMPMALPFDTTIEFAQPAQGADAQSSRTVRLRSVGFEEVEFSLDDDPSSVQSWGRYVAGMAHVLAADGLVVEGFEASVQTTIPVGASLSSSAALEVATGFGLFHLAGETPDPTYIAKKGMQVENEIIGIQSGIMDQLISASATAGAATRIDCRSLELTPVVLPSSVRVVIMDTMTRRELVDSEYDLRRQACERASADIGVAALRDASVDQLGQVASDLDRRRATHVVLENDRVLRAESALATGDVATFGTLMNESHASLRDDYEVSSEALDAMVDIARSSGACLGARMTGGGFAGSAVALIEAEGGEQFVDHIKTAWTSSTGEHPDVWLVDPSAGASVQDC